MNNDYKLKTRICPECGKKCVITPLSPSFDNTGEKYGGLYRCMFCGWYSIDTENFVGPDEFKKFTGGGSL